MSDDTQTPPAATATDPWPAINRVRAVAQAMYAVADQLNAEFLRALADLLTHETNRRHRPAGRHSRGILGGESIYCQCGGMSIHPDLDQPPPICDRLADVLAVAVAYDPNGVTQ